MIHPDIQQLGCFCAAQALGTSLRTRGISGYDILGRTAPADRAHPVYPSEAWFKKAKEDWYRDYVNRGPDDRSLAQRGRIYRAFLESEARRPVSSRVSTRRALNLSGAQKVAGRGFLPKKKRL
jgi:hypothetical protein